MNTSRRWACIGTATCLVVIQTFAAEYSLPLTDDAYIHGLYPTSKSGSSVSLNVHTYGPQFSLLRFDPAAIAGLSVNRATLILYTRTLDGPGNITVHPILSSWSEGTVTWALQPPSEGTAAANFDVTSAGKVMVDVTNVAQRWANGTLAHAGFLLKSPTAKKAYFDAKERSGGIAARLIVFAGDAAPAARILDLSKEDGCVIDEPGTYVLDRDWYFTPPTGAPDEPPNARCGPVSIRSEQVSIDMRGFTLDGGHYWSGDFPIVTIDTPASVSLMNGAIRGDEVSIRATVPASQPWGSISLSAIRCRGGVELGNRNVVINRSSFTSSQSGTALVVGSGSRVRDSYFDCFESACFYTTGSRVEFVQNHVSGEGLVVISGTKAFVADNIVTADTQGAILVLGNSNTVARNYVNSGSEGGSGILGIVVEGTGNVLDGNIVTEMITGIKFTQTGNFYGSNRVSAPTPFVGTDGQTDWGGNVSF